ncbi:ribonuclease Z [Algoriphagus lutimaris]|uniref:ribonuclease Z n=1 Tax=Algoriphagus lutimaris TaxID=613197 RepID=UPI00196AB611|nr:ribonuclease Z [Algoriphagus lutimaris]MBN3519595.1 ribonuclease Z [Algoriphagus lutimaris]
MIPDFEVTILGNTSSIPVHGRNHTSQLIRFGQELLLLDCGEGTQMQLRKYKIKTSRINHIFISHLHGDHYLGLIGLLSSYNLSKRTSPLTIYGPLGLNDIITTHFRWSNTKLGYPLSFVQTSTEGSNILLETSSFTVLSFPLKHRLPTTGFLITEKAGLRSLIKKKLEEHPITVDAIQSLRLGKDFIMEDGKIIKVSEYTYPLHSLRKYAFCSDTIFDPSIAKYLDQVDLLYHESTFLTAEEARAAETFHSTSAQAAQIASLSDAKSLLLGHFSSRYKELGQMLQEAIQVFPNSIISEEGQTYPVNPEV